MTTVPRLIQTFTPKHYSLSLDLSEAKNRTYTGTVSVDGDLAKGRISIELHSKDLDINSVTLDGKSAKFRIEQPDSLVIDQDGLVPGSHIIVINFSGKITDSMHGMYPCYYKHDGADKELIATQFESHHAREVFPCIDEPEAKATYDVTLTTTPDLAVLGNQPVKLQRKENGLLVTSFETTPKMSSYLLAWVVGELHKKTAKTKDGVEVNVWATPAQRPESLDFALDNAVKFIEFFNEYFDTPYPLSKCDNVALPDFSSGAMENWGLVTYRESCLLADPLTTTVASQQYIATVIAHELSHQWFGNLVTMKWWNNLWLNESFATLMEYIAVDAVHPEWNAWLDFASNETVMALRSDAIDGVQSVQVDVNHPDEISSLFDGAIVYAKGARLMRMCQQFVGSESFRRGLMSYFKEFAYKNTEADDLWRHLSEASGQDVGRLMNSWISQNGYPVVHVNSNSLRQEQFFVGPHQPSAKLWPIPLDAESPEDMPALLETSELTLPIANDERLNIHNASHFITHYEDVHLSRLLDRLTEFNDIGRLQLLQEQTLLTRGLIVPSASLIDLLNAYRHEKSEHVWSVMAIAISELKKFVETDDLAEQNLKQFIKKLARPQFERLGWNFIENEPENDTKLRSLILGLMIYSEDAAVIAYCEEIFAQGIENINPEIRSLVIGSVVKNSQDNPLIDNMLYIYSNSQSADLREDICSGITNIKSSEQTEVLLSAFKNQKIIRSQDLFRWFVYMIRNRHSRDQTWQWLVDNWQWIVDTFGGDKSYDDFPRYSASGMMNRTQLQKYTDFFLPKRSIPALTRVIDLGVKEIEARVDLIDSQSESVVAKLEEYYQNEQP